MAEHRRIQNDKIKEKSPIESRVKEMPNADKRGGIGFMRNGRVLVFTSPTLIHVDHAAAI